MPTPIRGPLSLPFRILGITQSKMNPNLCTMCERAFRRIKKHQHISATATILFADIRGYTRLSEQMDAIAVTEIVSTFQDQCAQAIWAHDGIVNKQMGDGLMAIFNFPIKIERHAEAAVAAARDIQHRCQIALAPHLATLGVGVGVHTGAVEIGEFSTAHSDFTAIGGPVNLAARLEGQAAAGEILVSLDSALAAGLAGDATRTLTLKGIDRPVEARVLTG
jgi:adenylate cyclase